MGLPLPNRWTIPVQKKMKNSSPGACAPVFKPLLSRLMRKVLFWIGLFALVATLFASPVQNVAKTRVADGFDFPVGKPDAEGYYTSRGFRSYHPGEDWNGLGGGNSDLGDPVHSIGHGLVVFAKDARLGWGNVVIIRHTFLNSGHIETIDSMYAHLHKITVREGQQVLRGQQVGTIGTNRGMYTAHLHFEVRKNLHIGINRSAFRRDFNNYYAPSQFISSFRKTIGGNRTALVAVNTFTDRRTLDGPADQSRQSGSRPTLMISAKQEKEPPSSQERRSTFRVNRYSDITSF
jgi:murein DD-endopeptidase MepM/ murein hydrolase activator NlpD